MQNFEKITRLIMDNGVEFVLIGGFAAAVHGVTLLTQDIDICVPFDLENAARIIRAFRGYNPRHRENKRPLSEDVKCVSGLRNLYLMTDLGSIDMLGHVSGVGSYADVVRHAIEIEIFGGRCRVLDIESLIKSKREMGRVKDKETIRQLKIIKKKLGR